MADSLQWEYRVESFGSYFSAIKDEQFTEALNAWGEEGWEVISVIHHQSGSEKLRVVARRPLTHSSRRRREWPGG